MTERMTFEAFFRDEYAALVSLGAWLTSDVAAGEDLAQEAMRVASDRWEEVGSYDRPGAFVRRVVINRASNERRRRSRELRAVRALRTGTTGTVPDERSTFDRRDPLWTAVAGLPVKQRAAIALRYLEDLDTATIASALDCSESTVRVHLHRAHQRLAEVLGHQEAPLAPPGTAPPGHGSRHVDEEEL